MVIKGCRACCRGGCLLTLMRCQASRWRLMPSSMPSHIDEVNASSSKRSRQRGGFLRCDGRCFQFIRRDGHMNHHHPGEHRWWNHHWCCPDGNESWRCNQDLHPADHRRRSCHQIPALIIPAAAGLLVTRVARCRPGSGQGHGAAFWCPESSAFSLNPPLHDPRRESVFHSS